MVTLEVCEELGVCNHFESRANRTCFWEPAQGVRSRGCCCLNPDNGSPSLVGYILTRYSGLILLIRTSLCCRPGCPCLRLCPTSHP